MTSFICHLSSQQVVLAMDTLVTDPLGNPAFFASKATHVPHLQTIVAGTGIAGFSNKWAEQVASRMLLTGIVNLDYHTARNLPELWGAYRREHDITDSMTTTVYQFGVSEENGELLGFAYRSAEGFASESLNPGWLLKPECTLKESDDFRKDIRSMMMEQRAIQEDRPIAERVFIGGECIVHVLDANSYSAMKLFDFEDFQKQLAEALTRFSD